MKKKNKKTLFFLILLLTVLIGAYAGITVYNKQEAEKPSETETTEASEQLLSLDKDSMERISVKREEEELVFVKKGDVWVYEKEEGLEIKQSGISNMQTVFSSLKAGSTISENREELKQYELENPVLTITAKDKDRESTLYVGMKNTVTGDYYAYTSEKEGIYTISSTTVGYFDRSLYDMAVTESFPAVSEASFFSLETDWKGDHYRTEYLEESIYDASGMMTWYVTEPFEHEYVAHTTTLDKIFAGIAAMSFDELAAYKPEEALLAKLGFSEPQGRLAFTYSTEVDNTTTEFVDINPDDLETYVLIIGNLSEDGSSYYVMAEGSDQVVTAPASALNEILQYNSRDIVNKYFALINISTVERVEFMVEGDQTYELIPPQEEAEDEAAGELRNLYQEIISINAEKLVEPQAEPYKKLPIKIVFHRNTEPVEFTVEFAEYDTSYYLAIVNGEAIYLVNRRDYDKYAVDIPEGFNSLNE